MTKLPAYTAKKCLFCGQNERIIPTIQSKSELQSEGQEEIEWQPKFSAPNSCPVLSVRRKATFLAGQFQTDTDPPFMSPDTPASLSSTATGRIHQWLLQSLPLQTVLGWLCLFISVWAEPAGWVRTYGRKNAELCGEEGRERSRPLAEGSLAGGANPRMAAARAIPKQEQKKGRREGHRRGAQVRQERHPHQRKTDALHNTTAFQHH